MPAEPFIVTSVPINPPWDQGDKNQAYLLTRALPDIWFRVIIRKGATKPDGDNLTFEPLYRSCNPSLSEKIRVFQALLTASSRATLLHFYFRPYPLSSFSIRFSPAYRRLPSVQTIPATADGGSLHARLLYGDRVVSISEHGLCALRKLGRSDALHIPPGVDPDDWQYVGELADTAKARLGVVGKPVVLFAGHYGRGQGSETMTRALPALLNRLPDARIIYACRLRSTNDLHAERTIKTQVREAGLEHAVRFYRHVEDMRELIAASDVVALPLESMRGKIDIPITLLEALAASKPVIVSDIAPMNEILSHSARADTQPGVLVQPGDALALSETLVAVLSDAPLRQHMGAGGARLVREHYNIAHTAASYRQLYQELST